MITPRLSGDEISTTPTGRSGRSGTLRRWSRCGPVPKGDALGAWCAKCGQPLVEARARLCAVCGQPVAPDAGDYLQEVRADPAEALADILTPYAGSVIGMNGRKADTLMAVDLVRVRPEFFTVRTQYGTMNIPFASVEAIEEWERGRGVDGHEIEVGVWLHPQAATGGWAAGVLVAFDRG